MYLKCLRASHRIKALVGWLVWSVAIVTPAIAQKSSIEIPPRPNPNLDRIPQSSPAPDPLPSESPTLSVPPASISPPTSPPIRIFVRNINVTGNTLFKQEIPAIIQPAVGHVVSLDDLIKIANDITQLYLSQGYITSRAVLVDQVIVDGVVQIRVIEGSLEELIIDGLQRLKRSYILSRLQLGLTKPLNRDQLEDQLRLLKADPLVATIEASLRPGKELGQSILILRVKESLAISGSIGVDNYSSPSIGADRLGGVVSDRNLTGIGDELSGAYYRSLQGGVSLFDFAYRVPVNPMNGTIQLRVAPSRSKIIEPPFDVFNIRSQTDLYELSYRQPLLRTPREELALSLGFTVQNSQTFLDDVPFGFGVGADAEGKTQTRVLKFGQDYVKRDPKGAWALRSQFSLGLNVLNATLNDGSAPDGRFFSWFGQVQRVQRLSNAQLLIIQADGQLTPDGLLSSQQFVIGGGQSLRGYRQNARSGDNGFRVSIEDRIALQRDASGVPMLQLAPFADLGSVWNQSNNPNQLTNETFLASAGLGLIWEPVPRFLIRLDYAVPIVPLSDRGNNAQDRGFHFSVGYSL